MGLFHRPLHRLLHGRDGRKERNGNEELSGILKEYEEAGARLRPRFVVMTKLIINLISLFLILTKKTASPKRGSLDCGINLFFGMNDDLVEWNIYAVFVEHIFQFAV